jgi:hypothetical protein
MSESLAWTKSTYSASGNCVETAPVHGGLAVRNSKEPEGVQLKFGFASWKLFTERLKKD